MLLVVLLLPPLALYLLALGWVNRRPRPVLVGGPWEFAGVLFALSGFLLFGGPALLSSLDERSRWFWLLGESAPGGMPTFGIVIRLLYFAVVAGGAALVLWRSRRLTSVYNVEARAIHPALDQAFGRLGLMALRTAGASYLIGDRPPEVAAKQIGENVQTAAAAAPTVGAPSSILHVDAFAAMRHVTLRWDPPDSLVRREIEQELTHVLAESRVRGPEPPQGGCLSLLGVILFTAALVAGGLLILYRLYPPH